MTAYATNCPHCGARAKEVGPYCAFCGSLLPRVEPQVPAVAHPLSAAQRFERLEQHASFPELLKQRPSASGPIASGVFGSIFLLGFVVLAGVMVALFRPAGALILFPIVIGLVGLVMLVRVFGKTAELATAELIARSALIAGERTETSGGGDGPTTTRYFVTLEDSEGARSEFEASGNVAGRVTQGDIGVAYIKADRLIEFKRVQV
ncbi:MAG: hypothetical protein JNL28_11750 [Planctomycetes bacterium]|nr:hypothetical protein [Planctomycetota bacterium]